MENQKTNKKSPKMEVKMIPVRNINMYAGNGLDIPIPLFSEDTTKQAIKRFADAGMPIGEEGALEIANFGHPQADRWVVWEYFKGIYVVLLPIVNSVVYKLLVDPDLAPNDQLRKVYEGFKKTTGIDDNYAVECIVGPELEPLMGYFDYTDNVVPYSDAAKEKFKKMIWKK